MGVHIQPSPMPYQASKEGGRSRHGRTLWNGIATPAAVVQPQRRQRHAESAARTSEWRCRAQAPRCRCARAARHRPPPIGGQDPGAASRGEWWRGAPDPGRSSTSSDERGKVGSSRTRQRWRGHCRAMESAACRDSPGSRCRTMSPGASGRCRRRSRRARPSPRDRRPVPRTGSRDLRRDESGDARRRPRSGARGRGRSSGHRWSHTTPVPRTTHSWRRRAGRRSGAREHV